MAQTYKGNGQLGRGRDAALQRDTTIPDGAAAWAASGADPDPGDLAIITFAGRHRRNSGTWTRDNPGTDWGWIDFDGTGWTRVVDEYQEWTASASTSQQRFVAWWKMIRNTGDEDFTLEVSGQYIEVGSGAVAGSQWRCMGFTFTTDRTATPTGTFDQQVVDPAATFNAPDITVADDRLGVVIYTGVDTLSTAQGFTNVSVTGTGYTPQGIAHKDISAGTQTGPTLSSNLRQQAWSFALEPLAGGIFVDGAVHLVG